MGTFVVSIRIRFPFSSRFTSTLSHSKIDGPLVVMHADTSRSPRDSFIVFRKKSEFSVVKFPRIDRISRLKSHSLLFSRRSFLVQVYYEDPQLPSLSLSLQNIVDTLIRCSLIVDCGSSNPDFLLLFISLCRC